MIVREAASALLLLIAALFSLVAVLGITRSKDNFAALHAAGVANVTVPLLALLSTVVATGFGMSSVNMLVLFAILTLGAPLTSHAFAIAERRRRTR